jgi:hypothetical protein
MDWIIEPFKAFAAVAPDEIEMSDCSGSGTTLTHCSCIGCLVVCGPTPNSFVIKQ